MYRKALVVVLAFTVIQTYESVQVQMPEAGAFMDDTDPQGDLESQVAELRRNVTELWSYVHELKTSVSGHLTHLRLHQVQLESSVHELQHHTHGEAGVSEAHTDNHHHSGEHHSHSGEQHSHTDDHSHGSSDHHHSGEQNSHTDDHHSHGSSVHHHSGEQHSHSGEQHGPDDAHSSHSHSHSHTTNEYRDHHHSGEQNHHHQTEGNDHHHDHKDSHETEDMSQQTQQAVDPILEPVVLPTTRQEHHHHHHHSQPHTDTSTKDPFQLVNMHPGTHSHHSHSMPTSRSRNTTVDLPKYSEYILYNFASCNVQPNRAIQEDLQQNVQGIISFWQKKTGGPLNIHVRLQGFNVEDHHAHQQQQEQDMDNETPAVGHNHGFHVHSTGDFSDGCQSTGPHFNPKGTTHAGPHDLNRHVGDFGNINCDDHGRTNVVFSDDVASLRGPYSIIGKSVVIHANKDDLGLGGDAESLKTGNAGTRIACCVIEKMDKLPIRTYRIIKTATPHQNHN